MNRGTISQNPFEDRFGKGNSAPIHGEFESLRLPDVVSSLPQRIALEQIALLDCAKNDPEQLPRLLAKYYYGLYREAFSADSKIEDEGYSSFLEGLREQNSLFDVHIFLRENRVVAGYDIQAFRTEGVSGVMIEHLVVSPKCRGLGIGNVVFESLENHARGALRADLLLAEVHDPNLMTPAQINEEQALGMDPFRRLRFWEDLGFVQIDAPYLVPSEPSEGKEFWRSFTLLVKALDKSSSLIGMTVEEYVNILRAYFGTRPQGAESDPNFCELTELVSDIAYIDVISPLAKRTFSQEL